MITNIRIVAISVFDILICKIDSKISEMLFRLFQTIEFAYVNHLELIVEAVADGCFRRITYVEVHNRKFLWVSFHQIEKSRRNDVYARKRIFAVLFWFEIGVGRFHLSCI